MMSSEEETEFGLYTDKLLKKTKRTRQRVDAGEPRNSYSSIPNFSSRPTFLGAGNNLYGAIFTQQQHFGLFGPAGFAPAKMLNELLGTTRQKMPSVPVTAPPMPVTQDGLGSHDGEDLTSPGGGKYHQQDGSGGAVLRCDGSPPTGDQLAAHHMLRDILQGRKHDLLGVNQDNIINNNNNSTNNNNNNDIKTEDDRGEVVEQQDCIESRSSVVSADRQSQQPQQASQQQQQVDLMEDALNGMETDSLPSPKVEPQSPAKPEDAKKARVENIVSGMRSSPAPPQVNGCKKRKLYQPQQHDSNADRYIDEEEEETEPLRQKQVEKNALKTQLRTMQEQLAEMQQKYVQLCTRMEQSSEDSREIEEIPSDSEQSKRSPLGSPVRSIANTPNHHQQQQPPQHQTHQPQQSSQSLSASQTNSLSQQVNKLKIGGGGPPTAAPHHFHNGLLHDHHHHLSSAAAMYLGVSQKFLLDQEARMAKEAALAESQHQNHHHHHQQQQQQQHHQQLLHAQNAKAEHIAERLNLIKSSLASSGSDLEGLADALKTEITASLSNLIDSIVTRFVHQRKFRANDAAAAAEQLNKDLLMASQFLEARKSPKTSSGVHAKNPLGSDGRPQAPPPSSGLTNGGPIGSNPNTNHHLMNGHAGYHPSMMSSMGTGGVGIPNPHSKSSSSSSDLQQVRPPMFQPPKPPGGINQVPLYGMNHPFCVSKQDGEQNEALSLVVTPKKKRHKVTDTRITPRTVSRILGGQDAASAAAAAAAAAMSGMSPASMEPTPCTSPRPPPYPQHPPPMLPVSLPTSVAIPNPGLHESQVFSPYSPFFHGPSHGHHMAMQTPSSPPRMHKMERESPPLHHPPTLLHPALLAAAQHGGSPDYGHMRAPSGGLKLDNGDQSSDCNSGGDISYDGMQPTSSTLTPMHLRKAKLMFFWVRYPSSAVLKMYFPDIKFNKNNTAQLVKWFSNFREFYYIQMEKYARQAVSEGVKNADDLHVSGDSELYRVLNLHYNRNNHIEVPTTFRFVVEQTLREFFKAIQEGRDAEQSWKKSIYKIISRLDDPVPEYFKSPNFLEQLE